MLNTIEKIALIPDTKLLIVEPVQVQMQTQAILEPENEQVKFATFIKPKVKRIISMPDVFIKLLSSQ